MEPIGPGEIGVAVGKAIPAFFSDAFDQFGVGGPQYLATGEPEGIVAQVGQAVGRSACRRYAAGVDGLSAAAGQQYENACRPYLDTLNPGDGIEFATPFEGGQCDNQIYLGTATFESGPEASPVTSFIHFRHRGPILGVSASGGGVGITSRGGTQNTSSNPTNPSNCGGAAPAPVNNPLIFREVVANARKPRVVSITACGLDNCGNPPPIVVPPDPRPDPQPPPFRFNPGPNIDIPINVEINPDGSINFDFGGEPVTTEPFEEESGGDGGGGGDPGDPTDPGSPGGGGDTGDGGSEEGEADPGEELVGLLVEVLDSPENANRFENNSAQPFRGIGYVRMGYPNRLGIDISGGTVISPQFFHAPQRGLTNWRVDANVGFNLRITPYYRDITE